MCSIKNGDPPLRRSIIFSTMLTKSSILRHEAGKKDVELRRAYNAQVMLRGGGARPGRMARITNRKQRKLKYCVDEECEQTRLLLIERVYHKKKPVNANDTIYYKVNKNVNKKGKKNMIIHYKYPKNWFLSEENKDWQKYSFKSISYNAYQKLSKEEKTEQRRTMESNILRHVHREMAQMAAAHKAKRSGSLWWRSSKRKDKTDCTTAITEGYRRLDKHGYPRCYFRMVPDKEDRRKQLHAMIRNEYGYQEAESAINELTAKKKKTSRMRTKRDNDLAKAVSQLKLKLWARRMPKERKKAIFNRKMNKLSKMLENF